MGIHGLLIVCLLCKGNHTWIIIIILIMMKKIEKLNINIFVVCVRLSNTQSNARCRFRSSSIQSPVSTYFYWCKCDHLVATLSRKPGGKTSLSNSWIYTTNLTLLCLIDYRGEKFRLKYKTTEFYVKKQVHLVFFKHFPATSPLECGTLVRYVERAWHLLVLPTLRYFRHYNLCVVCVCVLRLKRGLRLMLYVPKIIINL